MPISETISSGAPRWSRRAALTFATVAALTASLLSVPVAAHADDTPRDPVADRANLVRLWENAGPQLQADAAVALSGTDADVEAFVASGWQTDQAADERAAVEEMRAQSGPTERDAALQALDSADPSAVETFLGSGWQAPWQTDLRIRVDEMLSAGGPSVKSAAQAALDAGDAETLQGFIDDGWRAPWQTDQRLKVNQILAAGGPEVKKAAQAALDAETVDAYTDFIGNGWALATARDQESATIADLTGSAVAAAAEATRQADATQEAAEKAAAAADAAKSEARAAADLAASAHGNAQVAAAAAKRAATAASNAASAASEAIGAADAASNAARSAAAAASQAATAATRAGDAATKAYQAAGAAAAKAGDAATAKAAAQAARDTATSAKTAAQAAANAGNAANKAAQQAVNAANGAANDANTAANAAEAAAQASGDAGADAQRAHQQAAIARADAARAQRAATAAANFAHAAASAAATAADAANQASTDATNAAAAAEKAAADAGTAAKDAALATQHANAASAAAANALKAAQAAQAVYDAARQADNDRVAFAGEEADQAALAAADTFAQLQAQTGAAAEEAEQRSAETNQLITDAQNLATPTATAVADARKAELNLAATGGPWTKAAALTALGESDDMALDFIRTQLAQTTAQDDRDKLTAMADPDMSTGTANMKAAATAALNGSDADVAQFLETGDYAQRATDLRTSVDQVLASAHTDGYTTVAARAQAALDDGSLTALNTFLTTGQDAAAATDERVKVNQILAAAPDNTKTKAFAQAALDGPAALLHQFLTVDQYTAEQYDQQAAEHDAEMAAMLNHADQVVALAVQKANTAQSVAATARGDAAAAQTYADNAGKSATDASNDATKAQASAAAAKKSADQAAASARSAQDAADRAAGSAHDAERSAMWADQSAQRAAGYAAQAAASAKSAHDSAVAAHQSAVDAVAAAHQAVDAAKAKAKAEEDAARAKMRQECQAYLQDGVPNGQASYNKCLDLAAMTTDERATLAAKNAATCQTLFPNHSGKEFNACLQNTTDPAFDTDEAMIVKQMQDAHNHSWWDTAWKIGAGVLIAGGAIVCILAEPCGAILGAVLEIATPLIAPEMIGVTAAITVPSLVLGGAAVAEVEIGSAVEADIAAAEIDDVASARNAIVKLDEPPGASCANSFALDTPVTLADGVSEDIGDLKVGDQVLAADPATGAARGATVTQLVERRDTDLTDVGIDEGGRSQVIRTTPHHAFWNVTARTWVEADGLHAGDRLFTPDGVPARVTSVRDYRSDRVMRNLTVAGFHTYFVGTPGFAPVLAHNCDSYVSWVPENANMSTRAAAYDAGATGTQAGRAPALDYIKADSLKLGSVKFDGFDEANGVMIDRKLNVTGYPKTAQQAINQSLALEQNGYTGRWEVPSQTVANAAKSLLAKLNITNIDVKVVPE